MIKDSEIQILRREREGAYDFRKRRHAEWRDNYTLSRNKVITNRLTQRQTVNIPLMKYGLQTLIKEIDEPPALYFKNLDNNDQKEVYYNEVWRECAVNRGVLNIRDFLDKKNAMLYGRPFKKLNVVNGYFAFELVDPQKMLVDRFVDPADLDTAGYVIHTGIYKTLDEILNNQDYNGSAKRELRAYYEEQAGTLEDNEGKKFEKEERMYDMGDNKVLDPTLGETKIELNEFIRKEFKKSRGPALPGELTNKIYTLAVPGDAMIGLQKRDQEEVIGDTSDNYWRNHYPFCSWGTDPDLLDFWSDAPADTLRGPNEVLNSWYSQLVENRTLKNFNMHYYDSTNENFVPQTYDPQPWGWYAVPGRPQDVLENVQVADLSDSLDEVKFVIELAEKAVAATAASAGDIEQKQVTLGEVQLALANARERARSVSKFYTESWKDFGHKYIKMLEAASGELEPVEIVKEGRLGKKMYTKTIKPTQWEAKNGYKAEVTLVSERDEASLVGLQKLDAAMRAMPQNIPLRDIYNKKLLEFANLSVDDRARVEEFEEQNRSQIPMMVEAEAQQQMI